MTLISLASLAFAWSVPMTDARSLPEPPRATFVVSGAKPELWIVGASDTIRVDPLSGATLDRRPGRWRAAVIAADTRIWCGDAGVWAAETSLIAEPCTGLVPVEGGFVATTETGMWRWSDPNALPVQVMVPLAASPSLVSDGRFTAAIGRDGATLYEWDGLGISQIATGGQVTSLASGARGWTWLLVGRDSIGDVTRREVRVHGPGTSVVRARFDGDAARDLLVVHEDRVGVLSGDSTIEIVDVLSSPGRRFGGGTTSTWSSSPPILDAVPIDVNGDGCDEIAILTATDLRLRRSELCGVSPSRDHGTLALEVPLSPNAPIAPPPPELVPERPIVEVGSLQLGRFLGRTEQDYPAWSAEIGAGWAFAGAVPPARLLLPTFPALSAGVAYGGRNVRASFGIDSAGLLLWGVDEDRIGIHFAMLTTGLEFGEESLSIGPFVTAGLWGVGAGARILVLPTIFEDHRSGLELRLTWFHPGVGEAMVLYTARGRITAGDGIPVIAQRTSRFACHRFGIAIGAAVGAGSTANSWEFVGQNAQFAVSVSPAIAGQCAMGEGPARALVGATTAPWFYYFAPFSAESRKVHHLGTLTAGAEFGTDAFHIGPIVDVGVFMASAGVRAGVTPFRDRRGVHHGVDLRASAILPALPGFEVMAMYTAWYDPVATP